MKNSSHFSRKFVIVVLAAMIFACNLPRPSGDRTPLPPELATDMAGESGPVTSLPARTLEPVGAPSIYHLSMVDRANGWALSANAVLRTEDGGATWLNATPIGLEAGFDLSASLARLDANHAWLLVALQYPVSGLLYRTNDGGRNWSVAPVPFSTGDMEFLDAERGWMMADLGAGAGSQAVAIFRTEDGGATWRQVYVNDPTLSGASDTLPLAGSKLGLGVLDEERAWVGGSVPMAGVLYLYTTSDGGYSWSQQAVTPPTGYELAQTVVGAPRFFNSREGVFAATLYDAESIAMVFYVSHDGGQTWTAASPLTAVGSYSIASARDFWVWDGGPQIHVSHDGGLTWETTLTDVDWSSILVSFHFVDAQHGWALTADASGRRSLYHTGDGGAHWEALIP